MCRWQGGHWSYPASSPPEVDLRWCWAGSSGTHEHPAACSYQTALRRKKGKNLNKKKSATGSVDTLGYFLCSAAKKLCRCQDPQGETRGYWILSQVMVSRSILLLFKTPFFLSISLPSSSHHSPCVAVWWTSLVVWRPLSSSGWQYCGTGRPGRWADSPSAEADCDTPRSSPGKAGRSREPATPSCSSRCSQTERSITCSLRDSQSAYESGGNVKKTHNQHRVIFTYIDQAKVVLINRKLLRSNLFLQSRGIGALWMTKKLCVIGIMPTILLNQ